MEYSIKDGSAFSIMTGFGEQYFSPLAIELGASTPEIGLLASVPAFIASLFQLYTSKATDYFKSRRKIITSFVLLQALTWLPLAAIPYFFPENGFFLLMLFVSIYFSLGQFVGPVWNSLIGDLVNDDTRGRFFGMRNKITGAVAFTSVFIAGFILGTFPKEGIFYGYALIFVIAFAARLASWHYLGKMDDPPMTVHRAEEFSFAQYLGKLSRTNYGRFALYFGVMNFFVSVAAPFFTVYMLRDLRMSYFEYTLVTAAAALASFLAMTYWGRIADRFGNKKVLNFCGLSLGAVPLFWLFSSDVKYLILAQIISGFVWAGFNLSTANFIYDNVKPENRTRVFAYHNVLAGSSTFLGAVAGSVIASTLAASPVFSSVLLILFLISGLGRAATSLYFLPRIKEKRKVEPITSREFFIKYGGTGPMLGLTYRVVTDLRRSIKRIKD